MPTGLRTCDRRNLTYPAELQQRMISGRFEDLCVSVRPISINSLGPWQNDNVHGLVRRPVNTYVTSLAISDNRKIQKFARRQI